MALIARLISSATAAFGLTPRDDLTAQDGDEHLAAVALLVHVARADGVLSPAEKERLARFVRARYAGTESEARDLIARAEAFDAENRDLSDLVELIGRESGIAERTRLLATAWSVASADGALHEVEEALVLRLGTLLGLDATAVANARHASPDEAGTPPSGR